MEVSVYSSAFLWLNNNMFAFLNYPKKQIFMSTFEQNTAWNICAILKFCLINAKDKRRPDSTRIKTRLLQ